MPLSYIFLYLYFVGVFFAGVACFVIAFLCLVSPCFRTAFLADWNKK